jgi:muconolactone delta-isomerase
MEVRVPRDADPERLDRLKANEKARAQDLQRDGKWIHLWRVAGRYAAALKRLAAARETTVRELMAKAFNLLLAADRAEHPGEDDPTKGIIFDEAPSARGVAPRTGALFPLPKPRRPSRRRPVVANWGSGSNGTESSIQPHSRNPGRVGYRQVD